MRSDHSPAKLGSARARLSFERRTADRQYTVHEQVPSFLAGPGIHRLERNGMISRTGIDGRVLGFEYALTPLGRSLHEPFAALFMWTTDRMAEIRQHQQIYDVCTEGSFTRLGRTGGT
ncbi:transcriptional regulator [Sphingomonas sp. UV9]|uniref:winged helix-turn-helix transcriptional regulator n=1 Tax=Sphingomonas sp. UV9 TaxID=1851410 RepID=UPI000FFC62C3|nr:winged helix-turn-helix transcriptional regulator [Sphingomonas sp. UV9]RXD02570.1 transcriptional regulator [Sphingomonas sp. UV9]